MDSEACVRKHAWTCESPRQVLIFSFQALMQFSSIFFSFKLIREFIGTFN